MRTVARVMTVAAVMTIAVSVCRANGSDRELCFEFTDGTVITGRIDIKDITIRLANGDVLKIPVSQLTELNVGCNDRPGFVQRVETLAKALNSAKTRKDAMRELIALGPVVAPILTGCTAGDPSARRDAIAQILKTYKTWWNYYPDAPGAMTRAIQLQSKIQAGGTTVLGTVTIRRLRITSCYGPVTVKLDEVHRIRPYILVAPSKLAQWSARLRNKTHLKGSMLTKSLNVRTRYGTFAVPLAQVFKATFAANGKDIRVQCWNAHEIIGTFDPKATISLKTDKGGVDISAGEIATMHMSQKQIGLAHSADLGYRQQEAVIDALIRMKMDNPDIGNDTLSDAIMNISHKRVLPAFFAMLEKHKNNRNLQRQASYSIWILFRRWFQRETPKEISDMRDLNKDPMRSGEIWRQWYKLNRDRLVWDQHSLKYWLKKRIAK